MKIYALFELFMRKGYKNLVQIINILRIVRRISALSFDRSSSDVKRYEQIFENVLFFPLYNISFFDIGLFPSSLEKKKRKEKKKKRRIEIKIRATRAPRFSPSFVPSPRLRFSQQSRVYLSFFQSFPIVPRLRRLCKMFRSGTSKVYIYIYIFLFFEWYRSRYRQEEEEEVGGSS